MSGGGEKGLRRAPPSTATERTHGGEFNRDCGVRGYRRPHSEAGRAADPRPRNRNGAAACRFDSQGPSVGRARSRSDRHTLLPAGVGVMAHVDLIRTEWPALALGIVGSSILAVAVTALTMCTIERAWQAIRETRRHAAPAPATKVSHEPDVP